MKGKKLTSLLSLALAACLAFSVTGCNGRDDSDGANEKPRNPIAESIDRLYAGGLHKVNVTKTDNVLISEDGSTDYKIVYPKEAHEYELAAARYIAQQMIYAVDADIEVMEEDENLAYSANDKYIAVGSCKLFEKAGLTLPEELRQDGCYLKSVGNSVFVNSPTHLGIKRAATVFLEHTIGLEFIWIDTVLYAVKKGEKVMLPKFDIIEQADAAVGAVNGLYGEEAMMAAKITDADFYLPLRGDGNNVWHNSFVVFDEKNAHCASRLGIRQRRTTVLFGARRDRQGRSRKLARSHGGICRRLVYGRYQKLSRIQRRYIYATRRSYLVFVRGVQSVGGKVRRGVGGTHSICQ